MRGLWVVGLLAGCGRLGFDAAVGPGSTGDGGADGPGNGDAPGDTNVPGNLVAWYPLDDDFDLTRRARDLGGNNLDGTCSLTSCPQRVPGRSGFAARFDGTGAFLEIAAAGTALDFPAGFTIAAWVRPERRPVDFEIIVSRPVGASSQNSFTLDHESAGRIEYYSQPASTLFGMSILPLDTWSHVAISFDGTWKRLYVNGNAEGSASNGTTPTYDMQNMLIGADSTSGVTDHFFRGGIDDVHVFDRALSSAEINALAQ